MYGDLVRVRTKLLTRGRGDSVRYVNTSDIRLLRAYVSARRCRNTDAVRHKSAANNRTILFTELTAFARSSSCVRVSAAVSRLANQRGQPKSAKYARFSFPATRRHFERRVNAFRSSAMYEIRPRGTYVSIARMYLRVLFATTSRRPPHPGPSRSRMIDRPGSVRRVRSRPTFADARDRRIILSDRVRTNVSSRNSARLLRGKHPLRSLDGRSSPISVELLALL